MSYNSRLERRDFLKMVGVGTAGLLLEKLPEAQGKASTSSDDKITFFVLGDPQTHEDYLRDMVAQIASEKPDFVLVPGDCCMAKGGDPQPWDEFFDIFAPLYKVPNHRLYAIPGNHDLDGGYPAALKNWQERWDLPGHKLYYSFIKGPVYVAGLCVSNHSLHRSDNTSDPTMKWPVSIGDAPQSQIEWLEEDLKNIPPSVKWKFIQLHEPGTRYCRLSYHRDGPGDSGVSGYIEPLAFKAGVDLMFRGHQHFYERTYPINIDTGNRDESRGMAMITSGGGAGGAPYFLADGEPMWFDAVILNRRRHYCKATIAGEKLTWQAIDIHGKVFDEFSITKNSDDQRTWSGLPDKGVLLNPGDGQR